MKKYLCLFAVVVLALASCSSDDSTDAPNLQKTIKETYPNDDWDDSVQKITYNGNKIVSIDYKNGDKEVYTYTDDLITKKEKYISLYETFGFYEYTYEGTNMKTVLYTYSANSHYKQKCVFTHNSDGTISCDYFTVYSDGSEVATGLTDKCTYVDGNLTKLVSGTIIFTFEYDTKNNPYNNITGFNKLLMNNYKFDNTPDYDIAPCGCNYFIPNLYNYDYSYKNTQSVNNVVKETVRIKSYNSWGGSSTWSEPNVVTYTYEYNKNNYPTKKTSSDGVQITEYTY